MNFYMDIKYTIKRWDVARGWNRFENAIIHVLVNYIPSVAYIISSGFILDYYLESNIS